MAKCDFKSHVQVPYSSFQPPFPAVLMQVPGYIHNEKADRYDQVSNHSGERSSAAGHVAELHGNG